MFFCQLVSARKACQAAPSVDNKISVNVVSPSAESEKISQPEGNCSGIK